MKFRLVKEKELNLVIEMCEEIKKTYPLWDDEYPTFEDFYESFEEGGLYVLDVDGKIVGSICLGIGISDNKYLSLCRFMVSPDERKKGYGKIIFDSVEKEVLKRGYQDIDFLVHKDHPFGFVMYKNFGYTDMGPYRMPWDDGEEISYNLFVKKLDT